MNREFTLYYDPRTGAALMAVTTADETVYFPYDIETGKFFYGMHGAPLKGPPVQYFASQNLAKDNQMKTAASDLQIIKIPREQIFAA